MNFVWSNFLRAENYSQGDIHTYSKEKTDYMLSITLAVVTSWKSRSSLGCEGFPSGAGSSQLTVDTFVLLKFCDKNVVINCLCVVNYFKLKNTTFLMMENL